MSSPVPSASEPSEEEEHCEPSSQSNIRECEYEKWTFMIYRTTYDEASARSWEGFKDRVLRDVRSSILESDAPKILDTMDFVFVEDPTLESASVGDLQRHFRAWVEEAKMVPFEMNGDNDKVLVRGFPEDPAEEGREHVKVWHHAIGTELYDEPSGPNAAWTGHFYRSLPTYLVAQGC